MFIDPRKASVRFSNLKKIDKSPAHYLDAIQRGATEESLAMRLGSGTHAIIFGTPEIAIYRGGVLKKEKVKKSRKKADEEAPAEELKPTVRFLDGDPLVVEVAFTRESLEGCEVTTKPYSDVRNGELWELFEEHHDGKVILRPSEYELASSMARTLTTHPDADRLLFAPGTEHEKRIEWMFMGRRCSGTLDALGPFAIPDVKTTRDSSPGYFPRQARTLHYQAQPTWYAMGAEKAGYGWRPPYLIAVENAAPFIVTVFELTDDDIRDGERLYTRWMQRLLECEASITDDNPLGYWPGYTSRVVPLNVLNLPLASDDDGDGDIDSRDAA